VNSESEWLYYSLFTTHLYYNKMANLKEIRNRITSVSSTMQITSAMKMVSAAAKESTRCDYSHASLCRKLTELLQNLSATLEDVEESTTQREVKY
jgi:F-type H+-transporting ATPase subunit gamma